MPKATDAAPNAAPIYVSQLTSLPVLGIDARRFREHFRNHPSAVRLGKLVLMAIEDARAALRAMTGDASATVDNDDRDDGPTDVDSVLARLGRRRVA